MNKQDIIKGHYNCTCHEIYKSREMADPSCVLCEHGGEIELIMSEYGKQQSISFLDWFIGSNWKWYIKNLYIEMFSNETVTDDQLYDIYLKKTQ